MKRRNFLKGIFGAAVVVAVPIAVVNRIEQSEIRHVSDRLHVADKLGTIIKPIDESIFNSNDILFIYDEERLIGYSRLFALNFYQAPVDVSLLYPPKVWNGKRKNLTKKHKKGKKIYEIDYHPTYHKGSKQWTLDVDMVNWEVDPMLLLENNKMLNCLIKHGNMKITGDIYLTSHSLSIPMYDGISGIATFEGSGELITILEKG